MEAHHTEAYGFIDNDGLAFEQIAQFSSGFVFALPVFSVESFYYCREVLESVAQQKKALGDDPAALLSQARESALKSLSNDQLSHLAARLTEQRVRNSILSQISDRQALIARGDAPISQSVSSPYPSELAHIKGLLAESELDAIVERYPVRYSHVLATLAKGLGFEDRAAYERAALVRIGSESSLREILRTKLGALDELLD